MKSQRQFYITVMFAAVAILRTTWAFAGPITFPLALTGRGSGNEIGAAGVCNGVGNTCTDTTCECYQFSGNATLNNNIGTTLASTNFILNLSALLDNLDCLSAHGVLTLTQKTNAQNILALDYQGLDCLDDSSSEFVFNGAYSVDNSASKGKFAKALGSGTFTAGVQASGTITLGNINGTLQLMP